MLQVTRADVTRMLRADALEISLGVLLIAAGAAALFLYARPLRRHDPALAWLSLFSLLYGVRLLARTDTVPVLFDLAEPVWDYMASAITYVIPLPGVLFLRRAFPKWQRPLGWAAAFLAGFAIAALASDLVQGRPDSARAPNNLIAIAFLTASLVLLFRPGWPRTHDVRTLRVGVVALVVTAVVDNLRGLEIIRQPRIDVEPIGFTVLVVCLGTIAARRALEAAERLFALDRELSIAREIQASILPRAMPSPPGLHVAARYEPMTAVAGDFYEFLDVGQGRLGVLVADVSGHGVPAALIASMVKVAANAQRAHADQPAAVLAGMNQTLAGQLGSQYVTAAYLFLDRPAGVMRYAAAGHPPLVRWRADETCALESNGLPLGLMDFGEYAHVEQAVRPGDRFLLYTDGLVDAEGAAGELFELARVEAALREASRLPAPQAADAIVAANRAWATGAPADDLTLVLVECV